MRIVNTQARGEAEISSILVNGVSSPVCRESDTGTIQDELIQISTVSRISRF